MPNPQNERDRVLSDEEWSKLYQIAKPHLRPVFLTAYQLRQRFSEIVRLTLDPVDVKRGFITLRALDTKTKNDAGCEGDTPTLGKGPEPSNSGDRIRPPPCFHL